jgi:hypothetical protein
MKPIFTAGTFRLLRLPPIILLALACAGDALPVSSPFAPPVILSISPPGLDLAVGQDLQLTGLAYDAKGRLVSIAPQWSSADPAIATVGRFDGLVTAMSSGTTTVTARAGALSATATVTVQPDTLFAQWASGATASSEYTSDEWSANQATGAPNVTRCEDNPSAWASMEPTVDWLEVTYAQPVRPIEIRIHEIWAVGSIVKVEVKDLSGAYQTVYTAQPTDTLPCPHVLTIPVTKVTAKVSAVRVTVDQRARADWNEIDAVRLTGGR